MLVDRFLGVFSESETQCCCLPEVSTGASLKNYPLSLFALFCLMWTIFKVFIEFVTMLLLLFMFWFLFVGWFFWAVRHAGSWLPDRGSNLHLPNWKVKS